MAADSRAQRSLAALRVSAATMLAFCGADVGACSLGTGIREKDLAWSYQSSDEVFVARLISYRVVPPPPGGKYMLRQSDYELIEAIKGQPAQRGVLTETDSQPVLPGDAPAPACGPWLVSPNAVGATALVMTRPFSQGGVDYVGVDPFSNRLDPAATPADDDLELILRIHDRHLGDEP
jgi:hypothetical protein